MSALSSGDEKRALVRAMFERIAPRYDLMNRLLTAGMDRRWRSRALHALRLQPGERLLDLACGTGDLALQAARAGVHSFGVDFAAPMLHLAAARAASQQPTARATIAPGALHWVQGDAERLPLRNAAFDAVCCGFALRNFASLPAAISEMARVLRPGGRIALLDVDRPRSRVIGAAHSLYFDRIVPIIGGWLSDRRAYRYLPQSTAYLPPAPELHALLKSRGFADIALRRFLFGTVQLWIAARGAAQ